jgi:hypothetical protein
MSFAHRSRAATIAAVAICPAIPAPADAATQSAGCTGPELSIAGTPETRWDAALETVRLRLQQKLDLDRCARIRLEPAGDEMSVHVTLPDGRRAGRRVNMPGRLLEAVEALLVLPTMALARDSELVPPDLHADVAGRSTSSEASLPAAHLELGLGAEGRLSGAPAYGGVGAVMSAELALNAWLVGIGARWDVANDTIAGPSPGGFNMEGFALAVAIGRRITAGEVDLDGLVRPEIVVDVQEADGPGGDGIGGTESDVRFDGLLRVSGPRVSRTRFFAAADFEVSPSRVRNSRRIDPLLPRLPYWSSGLAVGIIWGAF